MRKLLAQFKFSPGTAPKWIMVFGMVYFSVMFVEEMLISCMLIDESAFGEQAVRIYYFIKNLFANPGSCWSSLAMLPFVSTPYTGFLKSYTAAPFVAFFGPQSLCSLRIQYLFWGIAGFYCMYYALRRVFGLWPAVIATVMLATDTFFIRSMVLAVLRDEVLMNAMFWMAVVCFLRAFDNGRFKLVWLFFGGLIVGLGLWAKFIFAGYLLGLAVCLVVIGRKARKVVFDLFLSSWLRAISFFFGVIIGFFPMIYHNIHNGFPSFAMFLALLSPVSQTRANWDNSDVVMNFLTRLADLFYLICSQLDMNGGYVYNGFSSVPDIAQLGVFIFAFAWLIRGLWRKKGAFWGTFETKTMLKAMFIMSVILFLGTCILPGQYSSNHILILLPFVKILIAVFIVSLCVGNFAALKKCFVSVLICLSFAVQAFNLVSFHQIAANGHGMNEYFYPRQMEVVRGIEGQNMDCLIDATDSWGNVWRFFTNRRVSVACYVDFRRKHQTMEEDLCIREFYNRFLWHKRRCLYVLQLVHSDSLESGIFIKEFPIILSADGGEMRFIKTIRSPEDNIDMFSIYEIYWPEHE